MAALPGKMALFYLLLISCCTLLAAFNLDTDNVISKSGDPGSLFGFSMAMHWQLDPEDKRLLLVGAPRTKAFPLQKANVTGGLYSCDVTSPSKTCTRVVFDETVNLNVESKENQWMGVSVQSQGPGGKVVTCAHRYEKRRFVNTNQESRDITGRCYVLSQDLTISDEMDGGEWNFCDGRLRGHEKFGSCQQGVSATFTKDYHYVVFGAPGTYNWKGVVRAEHKNSTLEDMLILEDGPYETGGENKRDPDLVPVPANSYLGFSLDTGRGITSKEEMTFVSGAPRANHSGAVVLLKKFPANERMLSPEFIFEGEGLASSFGYDVAVVDLNKDGWQDIVVGAPQYFDKNDKEIGGAIYVYMNEMGRWTDVKPIRIVGTKDSMFGISVKNIGDINQDGFPDIAVGAPYDDGFGKVYIYHGSRNGIMKEPAQVIEGKSTNTRSFGYSIAGNLDLDQNFYPDIAVGSLSDSVNVYRSRPVISIKKTINVKPDKIDYSKRNCDVPSGICLDVEACFEYTAYPKEYNPVLTLSYTFEVESEKRQSGSQLRVQFIGLPHETQLTKTIELRAQNQKRCVQTKLQLQENIRDKLRQIPVSVSVEIKNARRKKRQNTSLPELMPILNSNEPKTATANVQFLKEGCGEDNVCNSNMKMTYKFCTRDGSKDMFTELKKENGVPVLALKNQKDIALEITVTNNPSDPANPKKDGDDAHEAFLTATLPRTLSYSTYREVNPHPDKPFVCASNQNGSVVSCELGNPFKRNANGGKHGDIQLLVDYRPHHSGMMGFVLPTAAEGPHFTQPWFNTLTYLSRHPLYSSQVTFYLILSTNEISVDTTDLEVALNLETTSSQANLVPVVAKARVVVELLLSVFGVAKPSQVYFGGNVVGESAMKSEDDIGSPIDFEFKISNFGRPLKALGTAFLNIQWPKEINNGKWLLYLVKMGSVGLERLDCQPSGEINKLKLLETGKLRGKREVGEKQTDSGDASFSLFSDRKYLTLDCNTHAKCVNIKCPLQGLDSNAIITAKARLWNSTFLEEYLKMNYLDILVKASINVDTVAQNIKLSNNVQQVRVTVFPEKTVAQYSGVPWWIILVAILAGILMLALLVFLLWKLVCPRVAQVFPLQPESITAISQDCGFFRRNKKDQFDATYHKAEIHAQPS